MTSRHSTLSAEYTAQVTARVQQACRDNGWKVTDPVTVNRIAEVSALLGVDPASWFHPLNV